MVRTGSGRVWEILILIVGNLGWCWIGDYGGLGKRRNGGNLPGKGLTGSAEKRAPEGAAGCVRCERSRSIN